MEKCLPFISGEKGRLDNVTLFILQLNSTSNLILLLPLNYISNPVITVSRFYAHFYVENTVKSFISHKSLKNAWDNFIFAKLELQV